MTNELNSNSSQPSNSSLPENQSAAAKIITPDANTLNATVNSTASATLVTVKPSSQDQFRHQKEQISQANPDLVIGGAIAVMLIGLAINNSWLGIGAALITLLITGVRIWPVLARICAQLLPPKKRSQILVAVGIFIAFLSLLKFLGVSEYFQNWSQKISWEAFGTIAEWFGALGQIFIAILAVYIAWQQYVISRDLTLEQNRLTTQQNILTQQQTIDAYFQGISELALDDEGLLEDWPQERAFCEGRTAAILSSVDASGKAKVLRFLSQSRLLTPLKRDRHLGRPILNGDGGYEEDCIDGVRVIDLGIMLAGANLAGTDLRWTELREANMIKANLTACDLVKANLARTILYEAKLIGADLKGAKLFYGKAEAASPRSRTQFPDYQTGLYTGAVIENADFTNVQRLDDEQRYYCCAWCGEKARANIPGGCEGIPNKLGR